MGAAPLVVRPAKREDYPALQSLFAQTDALHAAAEPTYFRISETDPRPEGFLDRFIAAEEQTLLVAEASGQVIGLVMCEVRRSLEIAILQPRRWLYIGDIVVDEGHRQRGVGRALMEAAYAWGRAKGVKEVELNVWEFNTGAIRFYEALGYWSRDRKMVQRLE